MLESSGPQDQATEGRGHTTRDRRVPEQVGKQDQHLADGPPPCELPEEPEVDFELTSDDLGHAGKFENMVKRQAKTFALH